MFLLRQVEVGLLPVLRVTVLFVTCFAMLSAGLAVVLSKCPDPDRFFSCSGYPGRCGPDDADGL